MTTICDARVCWKTFSLVMNILPRLSPNARKHSNKCLAFSLCYDFPVLVPWKEMSP